MPKDIYDPLTEYIHVFRERFREVAENTFAELAAESKVDIEANRETCLQIYANEKKIDSVKTRIGWWTAWCVLLWLVVVGGLLVCYWLYQEFETSSLLVVGEVLVISMGHLFLAIGAVLFISIFHLIIHVHPRLKVLKCERTNLSATLDAFKKEAWMQMSPLNRLYDWDILTRMMSKTVPRLEFDPYFTTQRLADLKMTYGWSDSFNTDRSVLYSHSGLINGNPFVICRTKKMKMGRKTYYGSKTIYWTTRERDHDGKYRTVQHSQVLSASVTAPYPGYYEKTRLIYGNTAAPDLIFYRQQSSLAGKEGSLSYKLKRRSLRKKARDLSNADFAMMTNEEFEVCFDTSNRNNNQQFALLFTPLAQESMLKLLRDNEVGYGDNFDFDKNKMINIIVPDHLQELNLEMNPDQYHNFDYDKAKEDFYTVNARCFRAIYFSLAPLLCVPMYQQIRPQHDIYGYDMQRHSAFWEHEALANFWGQNYFKHPACVTDSILKTEQLRKGCDNSSVTVYAHGYRSEQRLSYISQMGGDGKMHSVPVYWDEYLPVTGSGYIYMKEDNQLEVDSLTPHERLNHTSSILGEANLDLYRRHIASRVHK
ncbi:MAG: MAG1210 family protein [Bacteroidales bacterium]